MPDVPAVRQRECPVDLTHGWNHWPLMPLAVDEARQRIGLLPKFEALRAAA